MLVLLAAAQAVPWLAHTFTLDLPRLNTIVAFWRNLFCVWKDLYPGFLTRFLPMAFVYTPLQGIVAVHQYLGGCVLNLHLGVRTILAQRAERRRLSSWQEVARESARDGFSALLKDSSASAAAAGSGGSGDGNGLHVSSSVRKTARSVLAVESIGSSDSPGCRIAQIGGGAGAANQRARGIADASAGEVDCSQEPQFIGDAR